MVRSVTPTGISVEVTLSPGGCARMNPLMSNGSTVATTPDVAAPALTMTVTNRDRPSCAPRVFQLASTLPALWAGQLSAANVAVPGGESANFSLVATPPHLTGDGTHIVELTAQSSAPAASLNALSFITTTRGLTMTFDKTPAGNVPRGTTVTLTGQLLYDGRAGLPETVNKQVRLMMQQPNGATSINNGPTNASGQRSWVLGIGTPGTWQFIGFPIDSSIILPPSTTNWVSFEAQ